MDAAQRAQRAQLAQQAQRVWWFSKGVAIATWWLWVIVCTGTGSVLVLRALGIALGWIPQ